MEQCTKTNLTQNGNVNSALDFASRTQSSSSTTRAASDDNNSTVRPHQRLSDNPAVAERSAFSARRSRPSSFESFITVAISTLLTVLLAWRILLVDARDDEKREKRKKQFLCALHSKDMADAPRGTLRYKSTHNDGDRPVAGAPPSMEQTESPLLKQTESPFLQQTESPLLEQTESPLPEQTESPLPSPSGDDLTPTVKGNDFTGQVTFSRAYALSLHEPGQPTNFSLPNGGLYGGAATELNGYESDVSESDAGLPPYLDTITEEDTDDLKSISSGNGDDLSSKTLVQQVQSLRDRLHEASASLDTESSDSSSGIFFQSVQRRPLTVGPTANKVLAVASSMDELPVVLQAAGKPTEATVASCGNGLPHIDPSPYLPPLQSCNIDGSSALESKHAPSAALNSNFKTTTLELHAIPETPITGLPAAATSLARQTSQHGGDTAAAVLHAVAATNTTAPCDYDHDDTDTPAVKQQRHSYNGLRSVPLGDDNKLGSVGASITNSTSFGGDTTPLTKRALGADQYARKPAQTLFSFSKLLSVTVDSNEQRTEDGARAMEVNYKRSLAKFRKNSRIYRDAIPSGMEEFDTDLAERKRALYNAEQLADYQESLPVPSFLQSFGTEPTHIAAVDGSLQSEKPSGTREQQQPSNNGYISPPKGETAFSARNTTESSSVFASEAALTTAAAGGTRPTLAKGLDFAGAKSTWTPTRTTNNYNTDSSFGKATRTPAGAFTGAEWPHSNLAETGSPQRTVDTEIESRRTSGATTTALPGGGIATTVSGVQRSSEKASATGKAGSSSVCSSCLKAPCVCNKQEAPKAKDTPKGQDIHASPATTSADLGRQAGTKTADSENRFSSRDKKDYNGPLIERPTHLNHHDSNQQPIVGLSASQATTSHTVQSSAMHSRGAAARSSSATPSRYVVEAGTVGRWPEMRRPDHLENLTDSDALSSSENRFAEGFDTYTRITETGERNVGSGLYDSYTRITEKLERVEANKFTVTKETRVRRGEPISNEAAITDRERLSQSLVENVRTQADHDREFKENNQPRQQTSAKTPISPPGSYASSSYDRKRQPQSAPQEASTPKVSKVTVHSAYQPTSTPLSPPSGWRQEVDVKRGVISPEYEVSTDHLQKLIEQPYYERGRSRETLFPVTPTKKAPPSYMTEAVTSPASRDGKSPLPLSEQNVQKYLQDPSNRISEQQKLMRWRNSMNLTETELFTQVNGQAVPVPDDQIVYSNTSTAERQPISARSLPPIHKRSGSAPEDPPARPEFDEETERAIKQAKSNRYKAKITKAKKEYLNDKASASDLYKTPEEFEEKFKVSVDNLRKPRAPRGPLLEKFNSPHFKSNVDITVRDIQPNYITPKPLWDDEYKEIVKRAEKLWSNYRKRVTPPKDSMYAKNRAFSTGYLETDVDTGFDQRVSRGEIHLQETDMDHVHKSGQELSDAIKKDHESRSRIKSAGARKEYEDPDDRASHIRARSMDYIMDRRHREEVAPPENELRKIMGDESHELSEHELRFLKSQEKLVEDVPRWYRESEYFMGHKYEGRDSKGVRQTPSMHSGISPYPASTPEPAKTPETPGSYSYDDYRYTTAGTIPSRPVSAGPGPIPTMPKSALHPSEDSRYVSPWTYGRISGPRPRDPPPIPPKTKKPTEENNNVQRLPDLSLPRNFFAKYRDEIEDMRKSRSGLNKKTDDYDEFQRNRGAPPVAAVAPRVQGYKMDSSTSTLEAPTTPPPGHAKQAPPVAAQRQTPPRGPPPVPSQPPPVDDDFAAGVLKTSTPYSSGQLPRKPVANVETPVIYPPEPPPAHKAYTGYTVATPSMAELDMPRNRNSRVIEVADAYLDTILDKSGRPKPVARHVTLEEVLDSLLGLPNRGAGAANMSILDESIDSLELPAAPPNPPYVGPMGPGVFSQNSELMQRASNQPHLAAEILKNERLHVRCQACGKVRELQTARQRYVTCRYCYTYYCTRACRRIDWPYHKDVCTFARVNSLCKEIILKARTDQEAQWQMSRVARQGYTTRGRGSVNLRFRSPDLAEIYLRGGWSALVSHPGNYLYYYTVQDLLDHGKDKNLVALCRRYDPKLKLILSISVIADIDECPETPLLPQKEERQPAKTQMPASMSYNGTPHTAQAISGYDREAEAFADIEEREPFNRNKQRAASLPPSSKKRQPPAQADAWDASSVLRSVLKSMENIAPTTPRNAPSQQQDNRSFERAVSARHTVTTTSTSKIYRSTQSMYQSGLMLADDDADESAV